MILGGGLAGLAAAVELVDHDFKAILIERQPRLGGRASSFFDKRIGEEVDIGQHVFLRCCSAYVDFLKKIGAWEMIKIQPRLAVEVRSRDGKVGKIFGSALPGPLYLLPSSLKYPFLAPSEKMRALRALLAVLAADRTRVDGSFRDWLIRHHQTDRLIERLWDFLALPTLNDHAERVSAKAGLMVLQEAFLKEHGADIGYAHVELSKLATKAADYIRDHGGKVLLGKGARALLIENDRLKTVELSDGQALDGELFISALPPEVLLKMLPDRWRMDPFFTRAEGLKWNPIVNLYLWFDREVMDEDFVAFLDSPVQWVFNRSKILGHPGPGQQLCLSLSNAWGVIDLSPEGVLRRLLPELQRLLPRAREAQLGRYLVTKQRRATISMAPGIERWRLSCQTPIKNLFLAGDWTATGWPSTMEGAVRSGLKAAQEALLTLGHEIGHWQLHPLVRESSSSPLKGEAG